MQIIASFCGTVDVIRGLDLQVFGLPYGILSCGRGTLSPITCKEAPPSTMYILFFDCKIGFGLDVFAASIEE